VLFVGLSGNDQNLSSILTEVSKKHPSRGSDFRWGVRFAVDTANDAFWYGRGVSNQTLANYDDLPRRLLKIGRMAADLRREQLGILS